MPKSDGTTARTRAALIEQAGFKASDFLVDDKPKAAEPAKSTPPSGDPTRKMNLDEYDAQKAKVNASADEKYRAWKAKMRSGK
jgi:hypothetical protein